MSSHRLPHAKTPCRNVKLVLQAGEEWRPVSITVQSSRGPVHVELDQPFSASGQQLCCNCRAPIATTDTGSGTASMLLLFCSVTCASDDGLKQWLSLSRINFARQDTLEYCASPVLTRNVALCS